METKFDEQALDRLLEETMKQGGPLDQSSVTSLVKQMTKRLLERALQGELTHAPGLREARGGRPRHRQLAQRRQSQDPEGRRR